MGSVNDAPWAVLSLFYGGIGAERLNVTLTTFVEQLKALPLRALASP